MLKKLSDKISDITYCCSFCHDICTFACPVFEAERKTITYPSRKALIGYNVERGWVKFNEEIAETLYHCISCRMCFSECVYHSLGDRKDPTEVFKFYKSEAYKEGIILPFIKKAASTIAQGSLYGNLNKQLGALKKENNGGKEASVVVVADADNLVLAYDSAVASVKLYNKCGVKPLISDVYETGYDVVGIGLEDMGIEIVSQIVAYLNGLSVDEVVCLSPKTYWAFTVKYPEWGFKIDKKIKLEGQYLKELTYTPAVIEENVKKMYKVQNFAMLPGIAVYHEGSYLARYIQEYESYRSLIATKFSKLIELRNTRFEAVPVGPEDFAMNIPESTLEWIAKDRLRDVGEVNPDWVIVSDPSSYATFKKYYDSNKVKSLSELMLETFLDMNIRV